MKARTKITLMAITLYSGFAMSDVFIHALKYSCDSKLDAIEVSWSGSYDENSPKLYGKIGQEVFDPWQFVKYNSEGIADGIQAIKRECKLSNGIYSVELTSSPCNVNASGENGGMISGSVVVSKDGKSVARQAFGECQRAELEFPISITVSPHKEPVVIKSNVAEFYK